DMQHAKRPRAGRQRRGGHLAKREQVALDADAPHGAGHPDSPHRAERDEGRVSGSVAPHAHLMVTEADLFAGEPAAGDVLSTSASGAEQESIDRFENPAECSASTASSKSMPVTSGTVAPCPLLGEIVTV